MAILQSTALPYMNKCDNIWRLQLLLYITYGFRKHLLSAYCMHNAVSNVDIKPHP